jgi:CBS domain-containing protein
MFGVYGKKLPQDAHFNTQRFIRKLDCPYALKEVLICATERNPGSRFESARDFCAALRNELRPPRRATRAAGQQDELGEIRPSLMGQLRQFWGDSEKRRKRKRHLKLLRVHVSDMMIRNFPTVRETDDVDKIISLTRENPEIETLPVTDEQGRLSGIIGSHDLQRVLDSDLPPHLINAGDIQQIAPPAVVPEDDLLDALREFGARDLEMLPVESRSGKSRKLVGLLMRVDVMRRYRMETIADGPPKTHTANGVMSLIRRFRNRPVWRSPDR